MPAWRRRFRALAWGLLLTGAFVWLRLEILLLHWFSGDCAWCLYRPPPWLSSLLGWTFELVVVSPMLTFVAPLFIWVLATFRREDLRLLRDGAGLGEL